MALSLGGGHPKPILQSTFVLSYPEFSPDGRWLAYASDETGRNEVYVQPHQALTRGYDVSRDGQTFYLTQPKERPPIHATHMVLVQNWAEELQRRVPPK